MRTHKRRRRDNANAAQHSLAKTRLPVMEEVISSTNRRLQNSNNGQTSEALQLTNICSLSQASDHYNSSIALLLDWGKASLNDPVADQTSVTSKDYKLICQVESEDKSATSLESKDNGSEAATESQPLSSEVGGNQKQGDPFPINSEKEVPEDVFCCILGWLARSTGKSLCSCKKDQCTVSSSDSASDIDVDHSYAKQPTAATLTLENDSTSLSSTLEEHEGQTNQANLSAEGQTNQANLSAEGQKNQGNLSVEQQRNEANLSADGAENVPKLVTEGLPGCKEKRDASTSPLRSTPLVFTSGEVVVQKPGDQNENLSHKPTSNIKKESAPDKDLIRSHDNKMETKCDEGRSPSHEDPLSINGLAPPHGSVHTSEVEKVNLPCIDILNIKKESDLEEHEIGKELCSVSGNKIESRCDKDPKILNRPHPPNGLVHASEGGNVKPPLIDVLNIKKENDLGESAAGKELGSLYGDKKESKCLGKFPLHKDSTVIKQFDPSIGSLNTSEAKKINLPCDGTLTVKESVTNKEPNNVFCCILSWLAQGTGKKVQCSCAGEGETEPSLPTSESDCILKIKEDSSVPDSKRILPKRNCSIKKQVQDLQKFSEETSKLAGQLSEPAPVTWQGLFAPQPETSGHSNRGRKRRRNASNFEEGPQQSWTTELSNRQLPNPSLTWLGMLGLQSKMNANAKGKLIRDALAKQGLMDLDPSHMQGLWPLNTLSEQRPDSSMVSSEKFRSEILNIIKAKTAYANGSAEQIGGNYQHILAGMTQHAGKRNKKGGRPANATKQKGGKWGSQLAAAMTQGAKKQAGKVGTSGQKQQRGSEVAAEAEQHVERRRVGRPKGKLPAATVQHAGKGTGKVGVKSSLRLISRTASSTSSKDGQDATAAVQDQAQPEKKRKKPGPKKGSRRNIVLLQPNPEVVQQTVDITLNYLSQIFFLEKLF